MTKETTINPHGLKILAATYLQDVDLSRIDDAWEIVTRVHKGRRHFSGELYVIHLLEVASTLASMHLDLDTILSGLLHGVLKEGDNNQVDGVTVAELTSKFGKDVAAIVEGSTRITQVHYNSKLASQAENLRKMFLAMAADIRVLLVKLVNRLLDMFLLDMVDREQQLDIARETMDVYAPFGQPTWY